MKKDTKIFQVPIFTEPTGPIYKREIATHDFMTTTPLLEGNVFVFLSVKLNRRKICS